MSASEGNWIPNDKVRKAIWPSLSALGFELTRGNCVHVSLLYKECWATYILASCNLTTHFCHECLHKWLKMW